MTNIDKPVKQKQKETSKKCFQIRLMSEEGPHLCVSKRTSWAAALDLWTIASGHQRGWLQTMSDRKQTYCCYFISARLIITIIYGFLLEKKDKLHKNALKKRNKTSNKRAKCNQFCWASESSLCLISKSSWIETGLTQRFKSWSIWGSLYESIWLFVTFIWHYMVLRFYNLYGFIMLYHLQILWICDCL